MSVSVQRSLLARVLLTSLLATVGCMRSGFFDLPDGVDVVGALPSLPEDCAEPDWPASRVITIAAGDTAGLRAAAAAVTPGTAIILEEGSYDLSEGALFLLADGVVLRSARGDPAGVVLDGGFAADPIVHIAASRVMISGVTLRRAAGVCLQVAGAETADTRGVVIYRSHLQDCGLNALFISPHDDTYADDGVVACSSIDVTAAGRAGFEADCHLNGIVGYGAHRWHITDNELRGFWCLPTSAGQAIWFLNRSQDTVVERNRILDSFVGVRFGTSATEPGRLFRESPCPQDVLYDHVGGVVQNNFIYGSSATQPYLDSGIAIWSACGAVVAHNTVIAEETPFSTIEWRAAETEVVVVNNLVSHGMLDRGGTAELAGNLVGTAPQWFVDLHAGDLHLTADATLAIDSGVALGGAVGGQDIDRQPRDDGAPDIGADER